MRIELVSGDITRETTDAIVNAANSSLLGGGGVDGAIHKAAGPGLLAECQELRRTALPRGLPVGRAVATNAYLLACKWVIHTVGPNWHVGQRDKALIRSCFTESLRAGDELGAKSISFPAISAGVYGWTPAAVAKAAQKALAEAETNIELARFVLFTQQTLSTFQAVFQTTRQRRTEIQ
ncbi:MAG: O-acetyl-ADP-ribose deacetylase [Propionibacteriaceae bacterium]|jgi:O-acetyl-ADP-ribose deacetylase (regulator of RNase III)|nr:O-acetyl-ADP-ribose deacetylase [Propionibacteriaceae bacterium]